MYDKFMDFVSKHLNFIKLVHYNSTDYFLFFKKYSHLDDIIYLITSIFFNLNK